MIDTLTDAPAPRAIPLTVVDAAGWPRLRAGWPTALAAWADANRFRAGPGSCLAVPGEGGDLARVVAGIAPARGLWDWAAVADALPEGEYRLDPEPETAAEAGRAALAWALANWRDDRWRTGEPRGGRRVLAWPAAADRTRIGAAAAATALVRGLINTPANRMGPAELARAAEEVARPFGARVRVVAGEDLLAANYPAIHAVGAGATADRAPRLIDLTWGAADAPRVTLVGKGVCFDTGGLDIKPASAMKLMKKDMGGAAVMLGLARMVMATGLPVRLRVLIPAVENAVSAAAMRPLDVLRTRDGRTVEVGHTDAEGRLILADALAEAASEEPALVIDCATLTGAARVALGPDLPALFCDDDALAGAALRAARAEDDPLWRLPLWEPYAHALEGRLADLTNAPEIGPGYAGAITAALFLKAFVRPLRPWMHLDMMAWNLSARPGRPEGGEAMGMRALFALLEERFGAGSTISVAEQEGSR